MSSSSGGFTVATKSLSFLETLGNESERRYFHYFRCRTAPQLAGYFSSEFWDCLVPLSTHHHLAVKHAVVALASLHERYEREDSSIFGSNHDISQGGLALRQYTRAISYLTKSPTVDIDACLVASILFACFETLRGHYGSALSHVHSSVKILASIDDNRVCQTSQNAKSSHCVPLATLQLMIAKLDFQSYQLLSTPQMPLNPISGPTQPGFRPSIPECFSSLEEAQNSLHFQRNRCLRAATEGANLQAHEIPTVAIRKVNVIETSKQTCRFLRDTFAKWTSAFQAFLDQYSETLDSKSLQGAAVLKINQLITTLSIKSISGSAYSSSWDEDRRVCEEVIDLASTVIKMQNTSSTSPSNKAPTLSLDVSTVAPLYTIVHRCRDPVVRRRAITLLYSAPRQEGLWNSIVTARVCEKIMLVEEAGLGEVKRSEDIPDSNRVSGVDVQFDMQGRRGYLTLIRRLDSGKGDPIATRTLHEVIEW